MPAPAPAHCCCPPFMSRVIVLPQATPLYANHQPSLAWLFAVLPRGVPKHAGSSACCLISTHTAPAACSMNERYAQCRQHACDHAGSDAHARARRPCEGQRHLSTRCSPHDIAVPQPSCGLATSPDNTCIGQSRALEQDLCAHLNPAPPCCPRCGIASSQCVKTRAGRLQSDARCHRAPALTSQCLCPAHGRAV